VNFLPGLIMLNTKLLNREVLIKWLKTSTLSTICTTSFIILYGLIFSITMCAVRNIRQSDSTWQPFLCGNLSAFALLIEQDERRKEILVVAFTQAMNIMYYFLKKRNLIFPIPKNGNVLLFCLSLSILMWIKKTSPQSVKPFYMSRILDFIDN